MREEFEKMDVWETKDPAAVGPDSIWDLRPKRRIRASFRHHSLPIFRVYSSNQQVFLYSDFLHQRGRLKFKFKYRLGLVDRKYSSSTDKHMPFDDYQFYPRPPKAPYSVILSIPTLLSWFNERLSSVSSRMPEACDWVAPDSRTLLEY